MIKMSARTTDSGKKAFEAFIKDLKKYKGAFVSVGVHEGAGNYTGGGKEEVSVVEVALWNEFGTKYMPERSFIRSTVDENQGLINAWRQEAIGKITEGKWTVEKALEAIGFRLKLLIETKIKSNVPPPNAPSTLAIKKRDGAGSATLMHTKLLSRSITYQVHMDEKSEGSEGGEE